jgi:hypothetical protein
MSVDEAQRLINRSWAHAFEEAQKASQAQKASLADDMRACGLQMEDFSARSCPFIISPKPGTNHAAPGAIELIVGLAAVAAARMIKAAKTEAGLRKLWTMRFAKILEA